MDEQDIEDLVLEPIVLEDVERHPSSAARSNSLDEDVEDKKTNNPHVFFSAAMGKAHSRRSTIEENRHQKTVLAWKHAVMKARLLGDPWERFHLDEYPTEKAKRYRYSALRKSWVVDDVVLKMEPQPFSHGAMRECYRLKKLSNFTHSEDWRRDSNNYVAKRYMQPVEREVYFQDVQLQMDAKLWGEEYNRHNPPKKVDIFQVAVLEFAEREGHPLFHIEHFIEGHYVKYNSNSGYVQDDNLRLTPHAFSHFTFERSGHELIVVDIQGVGDLYTDPQIHTCTGDEYGDGNLGTRGMALFFHTHVCNKICRSLGLSQFDLADSELADVKKIKMAQLNCATVVRGQEEICITPSKSEKIHLHKYLRTRSISGSSLSLSPPDSPDSGFLNHDSQHSDGMNGNQSPRIALFHLDENIDLGMDDDSDFESGSNSGSEYATRRRLESENSSSVSSEADRLAFQQAVARRSRPSCVQPENIRESFKAYIGDSILGRIHLDLARYHELHRFTSPDSPWYDREAAFFHLEKSSDCGIVEAKLALARMLLGLPHDILPDLEMPQTTKNIDQGLDILMELAHCEDRPAMVYLAKAYDTGVSLGTRERSWTEAAKWYEKASVNTEEGTDDPSYLLQARLAEMYIGGGFGLEKDPCKAGELYSTAADDAMANMKGRLATKYYQLAEEAWAQCEE